MQLKKSWVIVLVVVLITMAVIWAVINQLDFSQPGQEVKFGVTFSHKYAMQNLGLNWPEAYWAIINDLKVKDVRLVAHWDLIEERNNEYNFADLDWMIKEAQRQGVNVVLALGRRTPRWPECHDPQWIKNLSKQGQDKELLEMIEEVVGYFKKYENIIAWQVENEPFLKVFGRCPLPDKELIKQEVELVKSFDGRPVMLTDTGELSNWQQAASLADILGTTMYKTVWNRFIGVWRYPWPPAYYYYKARITNKKHDLQKIIVSELQAEPWSVGEQNIADLDVERQLDLFNVADFKNNLEYVKKAGFTQAYLWGAEWWYWLKTEKNMPGFWYEARKIWQTD